MVLLIPNLLKKDLASPNPAEAALAISCLGNIVTPELSQTLVADVYSLLNNHKPELRRRACLCLYKCFLRYPEALRPSFARLTECLEDDDQTVVQAAVTVLSELAMHNPKTYLPLAPKFYKLLTTSSSNWMTIKLVKVFGAYSLTSIGSPNRRSGSPSRTDGYHRYWPVSAPPERSRSSAICLTASRWKIQRARGQYAALSAYLALISPFMAMAVALLPVATSRLVLMP